MHIYYTPLEKHHFMVNLSAVLRQNSIGWNAEWYKDVEWGGPQDKKNK